MLQKVINIIDEAIKKRFTGSITINFHLGGVTNINRNESIKI